MEYFRERFVAYLDDGDPVTIAGFTWPNSEVFKTMAANDYDAHFVEWVGERKVEAKERARAFLEEYGVLPRFNTMMQRHQNGQVLPFVGAGMSLASGYRSWGDFIFSLMPDAQSKRREVQELLADGRFEEAAQCVHDRLGGASFAEECHNYFGRHRRDMAGPVCLFPALFQAEVITTNFDYVLNHVYEAAQRPFVHEFVGRSLGQAAQRIGNDPHCLIRLHGEGETAENRVLTHQEYEDVYASGEGLHGALGRVMGLRSFLFTGCSLQTDRTFDALCRIKEASGADATRHYAFLPYPGEAEREARREFLGRAEIHPIYYPPEDHDQAIEDLLITMIEGGF